MFPCTCCRCLQLDPGNLPALQSLAVSYTNEALQSKVSENNHFTMTLQSGIFLLGMSNFKKMASNEPKVNIKH